MGVDIVAHFDPGAEPPLMIEDLAGDEARPGARLRNTHGVSNLFGLAEAADRDAAQELLALRLGAAAR